MDIMVLSAWGEFLGGVAVVLSLIFVGVQVHRSTQASRAATRQAIADSMVSGATALIDPGTLTEALAALENGETLENLPQTQRIQLQFYAAGYIRTLDNAFYQYRSGLLDTKQWQSLRSGLVANLRTGSGKHWLRPQLELMSSSVVNAEFSEELHAALRTADEEDCVGET